MRLKDGWFQSVVVVSGVVVVSAAAVGGGRAASAARAVGTAPVGLRGRSAVRTLAACLHSSLEYSWAFLVFQTHFSVVGSHSCPERVSWT